MSLVLRMRRQVLVNTDPQRRCYNGAHFSSELRWEDWEVLDSNVAPEKVDDTLKFWRELNEYAVGARGPAALCEFEVKEQP